MKRFEIAAVAALAAATLGASAPADRVALDASFACASPADWTSQRRPDGVLFSGPRDENGVAVLISIRYVGPDNKLYTTAEEYVRRLTAKPAVAIPGRSVGPAAAATVAGRASQRVISDVSEFVPPHSLDTKEIPMREEQLAVPAAHGFYVISYRAPRALFARHHPQFERVLKSFAPKL